MIEKFGGIFLAKALTHPEGTAYEFFSFFLFCFFVSWFHNEPLDLCPEAREFAIRTESALSLSLFLSVATSQELPPDWSLAASLVPEIPDDVV